MFVFSSGCRLKSKEQISSVPCYPYWPPAIPITHSLSCPLNDLYYQSSRPDQPCHPQPTSSDSPSLHKPATTNSRSSSSNAGEDLQAVSPRQPTNCLSAHKINKSIICCALFPTFSPGKTNDTGSAQTIIICHNRRAKSPSGSETLRSSSYTIV